jgi:hypothetical protein
MRCKARIVARHDFFRESGHSFLQGEVTHVIIFLVARRTTRGSVAQLVEQRTENPRVGGSIPSRTTTEAKRAEVAQW